MVHGNQDKKIDLSYGEENFLALKSQQKQFLEIEGAGHNNVQVIGDSFYTNNVNRFLMSVSE